MDSARMVRGWYEDSARIVRGVVEIVRVRVQLVRGVDGIVREEIAMDSASESRTSARIVPG